MDSDTSATIGAITGVSALIISLLALVRAGLASRRAALVVRWLDSTLQVSNLGPARARHVTVSLRPEGLTRPREPMTIAALGNGYTHRLGHTSLMGETSELWIDLTWKDDRLRRQTDAVLVSQERTPIPIGPAIPDRQVDTIAARLGEGMGKALNQVASNAVRHRR
ncbi:hypothetical protein [Nocardioides abyssi]|uniref:SRPBCC family protein n=1 Tax=Nocardioides abyssi TaxID=3058370 RepID=A0ABT8ESI2_9ACTN|nr:hypothetical protein [Nocardioides abyssi]MDN4161116.1 hypothetical protein [Nocardioides abyssi]